MKNDKDINNSLSNIKKALSEDKEILKNNDDNNFFLLEDIVEKKAIDKKLTKKPNVIKKK